MGCFLVCSYSGNYYILPTHYIGTTIILIEPFQPCDNQIHLANYNRIMSRLTKCGHTVNLKILDIKASQAYKLIIKDIWDYKFQLVPPMSSIGTLPNAQYEHSKHTFCLS